MAVSNKKLQRMLDDKTLLQLGQPTAMKGAVGTVELYATDALAIKWLLPDAEARSDAEREIRITERARRRGLCGDCVPEIYGMVHRPSGSIMGPSVGIAMEYIRGQTFANVLKEINDDAKIPIVTKAFRSLASIHKAGVAHRDIKPDNLILTHDGRVVIIDFGNACADSREDACIKHKALGSSTPTHMDPTITNQASLRDWMKADVYSMAVTLNETLFTRHACDQQFDELVTDSNLNKRASAMLCMYTKMPILERPTASDAYKAFRFLKRESERGPSVSSSDLSDITDSTQPSETSSESSQTSLEDSDSAFKRSLRRLGRRLLRRS